MTGYFSEKTPEGWFHFKVLMYLGSVAAGGVMGCMVYISALSDNVDTKGSTCLGIFCGIGVAIMMTAKTFFDFRRCDKERIQEIRSESRWRPSGIVLSVYLIAAAIALTVMILATWQAGLVVGILLAIAIVGAHAIASCAPPH